MKNAFRLVTVALALLGMLMITGCPKENVTKTMHAAYDSAVISYNTAYDMLDDLNKLGEIPDDKKPKIKSIMKDAETALNAAGTALESYVKYQKAEDKDKFDTLLESMNKLMRDVRTLLYGE